MDIFLCQILTEPYREQSDKMHLDLNHIDMFYVHYPFRSLGLSGYSEYTLVLRGIESCDHANHEIYNREM